MTAAATVTKIRRTQVERSASTRARLLDATIECLFDLGYARTTTTEIAERAGLSRGAQLHHFPTKAELVTTAVEHLFEKRNREFRDAFTRLPSGADPIGAAIDLLWGMVSGPTFYAWLELLVAARTDPELRKTVKAIAERFTENVQRTFHELFGSPSQPSPFFELAPLFTFALMQGAALDRITNEDDPRVTELLDMLKRLATLVFPQGG